MENLIFEEFDRYSKYFDYKILKNKVFLITGAKGFLASSIIQFLLYLNRKFKLNLFIYATSRNVEKNPEYIKENDAIKYCKFDEFDTLTYDKNINYVIHTATPTSRLEFINNPLATFDIINNGTRRVLEFAKNNNVESTLYLSSVKIYGSPKTTKLVKEEDYFALDPNDLRNCYPLGKKVAEYLCNTYYKLYNLPVNIVRPSSVQGLFQPYTEDRIFNQILRCIIEEKDFVFKTKGDTAKTLVYTMDAVLGMLTILTSKKYGETYNLTDNTTFYKMREIVEVLFEHFNPKLKVKFKLEKDSKTGYIAPLSYNLSTEKLESLGWQTKTDLFKIYELDLRRFNYEKFSNN